MLAVKAACYFLTVKRHLLISTAGHGSKPTKGSIRTDVGNETCECDWEGARATSTHSPSACLHLGLQWVRLLKWGLINCVCTQPTQNYSFRTTAGISATLSEHFSHCLIASVDMSLLLVSQVTTIRTKNILAQTVSHFSSYLPHTLRNCHSHSWEAVSFPSLGLFDVSFQPHPCKQWISKRR